MTCHRIECVETEKALKERIKELEANVWYLKGVRDENLAASQAREQVLRDALEYFGTLKLSDGTYADKCCVAVAALSLPSNDTALREWGAKLLEDAADLIQDDYGCDADSAATVRNKAAELRSGE